MGFQLPLEAFDSEVAALRAGGVTFVTFEAPGLTWDGDIAVSNGGQGKAAWFRDSDGNIIGVSAGRWAERRRVSCGCGRCPGRTSAAKR